MITKVFSEHDCHHADGSVDKEMSYYGLSTDEKPIDTSVPNAATFYEMNTRQLFIFDVEHHEWLPM